MNTQISKQLLQGPLGDKILPPTTSTIVLQITFKLSQTHTTTTTTTTTNDNNNDNNSNNTYIHISTQKQILPPSPPRCSTSTTRQLCKSCGVVAAASITLLL